MYIDWEGRIKTNFVADNMMIYVENLKDLLKKKKKNTKILKTSWN